MIVATAAILLFVPTIVNLTFTTTRQIYDEDCKDYPSTVDSLPAGCKKCNATTGYLTVYKADCPSAFTELFYGIHCSPGALQGELTKFIRNDGSVFECSNMPYNHCPILGKCSGKTPLVPCTGNPGQESCCSPALSSQCSYGEGDCDSDADCAGTLVCGTNNCRTFNVAAKADSDCCISPTPTPTQAPTPTPQVCDGSRGTKSCCTAANPCSIGGGDCKVDDDCAGSLVCGTKNCQTFNPLAYPNADCCMDPEGERSGDAGVLQNSVISRVPRASFRKNTVGNDNIMEMLAKLQAEVEQLKKRTAVCGYNTKISGIIDTDIIFENVYEETLDTSGGKLEKDGYFTAGQTGVFFITGSGQCTLDNFDIIRVFLTTSSGNFQDDNENIFISSFGTKQKRDQCSGSRYKKLAKGEKVHLELRNNTGSPSLQYLKFCVSLYSLE